MLFLKAGQIFVDDRIYVCLFTLKQRIFSKPFQWGIYFDLPHLEDKLGPYKWSKSFPLRQ